MTDSTAHLTEAERHQLADGTLGSDNLTRVHEHLRICDACAADVGRLISFLTLVHSGRTSTPMSEDLWPTIRTRIERTKVVSMPASSPTAPAIRRGWTLWVVGAAAVLLIAAAIAVRHRGVDSSGDETRLAAGDSDVAIIAVMDSTRAYEQEAQSLLNKLELQRAMLRPDTRAALDRDLHVVDAAIAELKDAIARDPNNPALRQLLASSYRQKVNLLKRVDNAI
jgi:hypothetical protein